MTPITFDQVCAAISRASVGLLNGYATIPHIDCDTCAIHCYLGYDSEDSVQFTPEDSYALDTETGCIQIQADGCADVQYLALCKPFNMSKE